MLLLLVCSGDMAGPQSPTLLHEERAASQCPLCSYLQFVNIKLFGHKRTNRKPLEIGINGHRSTIAGSNDIKDVGHADMMCGRGLNSIFQSR